MKRKFKYSFARKKEAEGGIISSIYAGFSLGLFIVSAILSFYLEGNAGRWIGTFGLMAILFSACGFVTGLKSFKEKDRNYRFSAIGSLLSGVFLVGWLALFLNGV